MLSYIVTTNWIHRVIVYNQSVRIINNVYVVYRPPAICCFMGAAILCNQNSIE